MGRVVLLAMLAAGVLAASGCGSPTSIVEPSAQAQPPASVEATDGRLGGAVVVRQGRAPHTLARGGRLDVRDHRRGARRDGVGAGAGCPVVPDASSLAAAADATLCLLNGERADHGLAPLAANARLADAATAYAGDLVAGSYFSHTGRDGSDLVDRIRRAGYIPDDRSWHLGENLAWGTGALAAPAAIVQAWMNSEGHRANILNPGFREIGIGVAAGNPAQADGAGATYVTEFGTIEQPLAGAARPAGRTAAARRAGKRRAAARKARTAKRHGAGKARRGKRRVKAAGRPIAHIAK